MTLIQRPNKSPEPATLDHYQDRTGSLPLVGCNIFRGHADNEMNLDSARGFYKTILDWPINSSSSWVCSQTGRKERGGGDAFRRVLKQWWEKAVQLKEYTSNPSICWALPRDKSAICLFVTVLLDKSLRETEGERHFGKVFCHERTRVLRRLLHLSVVLSSSTGSGSLFPAWWSECVNSGAFQIHTTDCAQSVYYVKRAFDKK